jgi:hypothetical protein
MRYLQIILIFIGLTLTQKSFTQDTVQIGKRVEYFSEFDTLDILNHNLKNVYSFADYHRELIRFTEDSAKLEYCFYYDNKRYTHYYNKIFFVTKHDSILYVNYADLSEKWIYKRLNDSLYAIKSEAGNYQEKGFAKSIIPLEKTGIFVTTGLNADTLLFTEYEKNYYPVITQNINIVDEVIYDISEVDSMPCFINGNKLITRSLKISDVNRPTLESSINCSIILMNFVVDINGLVTNIAIERSCGDIFFEKVAISEILKIGQLKPGIKNSTPVNVRIIYPVKFKW